MAQETYTIDIPAKDFCNLPGCTIKDSIDTVREQFGLKALAVPAGDVVRFTVKGHPARVANFRAQYED